MHHCRFLIFLVFAFIANDISVAADNPTKPKSSSPKFELRDGERVVFLGNTLIERAQKYGYWETMLTARYPDRNITFRNLGWSGDTVWAESRGIFDPPAVGYKRMIEHVGRLKPTVIFVGYGNNEAFAGKAGLPAFVEQYNKLLDDLTRVSAEGVRFVILSPTWISPLSPNKPVRESANSRRAMYRNKLADISQERHSSFIDLFEEMELDYRLNQDRIKKGKEGSTITEFNDRTGQLTNRGYEAVGNILQMDFFIVNQEPGKEFQYPILELDENGAAKTQVDLKAANVNTKKTGLTVDVTTRRVPTWIMEFKVAGLGPGEYAVRVGQQEFARADHATMAKGISVDSYTSKNVPGPNVVQYEKLRQAIIDKNRLYFYRWRPQNITYLFGFRKHEQGQNAKELAEFDKLIAAKEAEINKLKKPVAHTYEIIRVKAEPTEKQNDSQSQKQ